jgi:hypothetical protein
MLPRRTALRRLWLAPRALPACVALALLLPGCYALHRSTLGNTIPSAQALAALEPGRTTREQVLQLLGPPDEFSQPALFSELSVADSRDARVFEERDVFGRAAFTWVREQRDDRAWLLWPLYVHLNTETRIDRLKVLFDDRDVVAAVGCERGIEAP